MRKINHDLEALSIKIRINILEMIENCGQGHLGGSLSIVDVLSVLYGKHLNYDLDDAKNVNRDMVVLSKGHAGSALYGALEAVGFIDKETLNNLNKGGENLPSHPDRNKTNGVDVTTGSLGQGVSVACGIATGFKMQKSEQMVYLIVGDGELNEGQCWEGFQYIAHYNLNNCLVIIDDNKKQLDGYSKDIINPFDIQKKMEAFNFKTIKVKGNDLKAIDEAITMLKQVKDQPICIVLDSIKGQGIQEYEELIDNHSVKFVEEKMKNINQNAIAKLNQALKELTHV